VQPQISATQAAERLAAFDAALRAILAASG
jgi:hypothetical protein